MIRRLRTWAGEMRREVREIPIASCAHFTGFRYGVEGPHPYEEYVRAVSRGTPREDARRLFEDFVCGYRPRSLGEALGVETERHVPLWGLPWTTGEGAAGEPAGWTADPDAPPDIVTHFSPAGIPRHRVEQEFWWLERALWRMRTTGYRPGEHGYVRVITLEARDGERVHIVDDGNHRTASLAALGETALLASCSRPVREAESRSWRAVRRGLCSERDALAVFRAYFLRSSRRTVGGPRSRIIDSADT